MADFPVRSCALAAALITESVLLAGEIVEDASLDICAEVDCATPEYFKASRSSVYSFCFRAVV